MTSSSGVFTINGTVTANGGVAVTGGTLTGTGTLIGGLSYSSSASSTFAGAVAAKLVSVTMNHAGSTLTLTGDNATGPTIISAGTLQVGNGTAGSLDSTSGVTVNGSGVLVLELFNADTFTAPINLNSATAALQTSPASGTTISVSEVISGKGSLTQNGAGETVLEAAEIYTGPTNITAGFLGVNTSLAIAGGTS